MGGDKYLDAATGAIADIPVELSARPAVREVANDGTALLLIVIGTSSTRPAIPRRIEVVAKRFVFEPAEITLKKGEAVDLVLTSPDVAHGIRIRELNLDLRVGKGKTADATVTPAVTGTFVGHCSVFCGSGHGQMTLTIHVVA